MCRCQRTTQASTAERQDHLHGTGADETGDQVGEGGVAGQHQTKQAERGGQRVPKPGDAPEAAQLAEHVAQRIADQPKHVQWRRH